MNIEWWKIKGSKEIGETRTYIFWSGLYQSTVITKICKICKRISYFRLYLDNRRLEFYSIYYSGSDWRILHVQMAEYKKNHSGHSQLDQVRIITFGQHSQAKVKQ